MTGSGILIILEDKLTLERIADYVRAFSQTMGEQLDGPYELASMNQ